MAPPRKPLSDILETAHEAGSAVKLLEDRAAGRGVFCKSDVLPYQKTKVGEDSASATSSMSDFLNKTPELKSASAVKVVDAFNQFSKQIEACYTVSREGGLGDAKGVEASFQSAKQALTELKDHADKNSDPATAAKLKAEIDAKQQQLKTINDQFYNEMKMMGDTLNRQKQNMFSKYYAAEALKYSSNELWRNVYDIDPVEAKKHTAAVILAGAEDKGMDKRIKDIQEAKGDTVWQKPGSDICLLVSGGNVSPLIKPQTDSHRHSNLTIVRKFGFIPWPKNDWTLFKKAYNECIDFKIIMQKDRTFGPVYQKGSDFDIKEFKQLLVIAEERNNIAKSDKWVKIRIPLDPHVEAYFGQNPKEAVIIRDRIKAINISARGHEEREAVEAKQSAGITMADAMKDVKIAAIQKHIDEIKTPSAAVTTLADVLKDHIDLTVIQAPPVPGDSKDAAAPKAPESELVGAMKKEIQVLDERAQRLGLAVTELAGTRIGDLKDEKGDDPAQHLVTKMLEEATDIQERRIIINQELTEGGEKYKGLGLSEKMSEMGEKFHAISQEIRDRSDELKEEKDVQRHIGLS